MRIGGWRRIFPLGTIAIALALAFASCAQSVKITAPRYALVYGVQNYRYDPLQYTVDDANGIVATLEAGGMNATNVKEETESEVTKSQIRADILSLGGVSSDSTIVFYYSGHGVTNNDILSFGLTPTESGPYIVPYDAVDGNGIDSSTVDNLIMPVELEAWLAQAGTKNIVVILDCCYSGGFVSSGSAIDASPQDYSSMPSFSAFSTAVANFGSLLSDNASASGQKSPIVISAAGSEEFSYDGTAAMQHGVFTYFLLQAASKGDSNGDGVVTTTEAFAYTQKAIISWGSSQTAADFANYGYAPFLPHISGGTRDLVLFTD